MQLNNDTRGTAVPPDHVDPQWIWSDVHLLGELDSDEHTHLAHCEHRLKVFRLCVLSDTLPQVLDDCDRDLQELATVNG